MRCLLKVNLPVSVSGSNKYGNDGTSDEPVKKKRQYACMYLYKALF